MTVEKLALELIRSVVCDVALSEEARSEVNEATKMELYKLTQYHDLAHLVGHALDLAKLLNGSELDKLFYKKRRVAVYRYEQIRYDYERICALFEEEKIPYVPLKGSVVRALYPEPWMRTSCDIDIFVDTEQLDKAINALVQKLAFVNEGAISHDVGLTSEAGVHLELHYDLIEPMYFAGASKVLANVWEDVQAQGDETYQKHMSDELFYFYHVAHMAKHFLHGGCGVRPFIDLWLLDNKTEYDKQKRDALLQEAKLLTFAEGARALARVWFSGEESTELTEAMQEYVFSGGVYGNMENKVAAERNRGMSKFRYVWTCIFQPYNDMAISYPILKKKKWLYPFYQVKRWFRILFRGVSKTTKARLKMNANIDKAKEARVARLFSELAISEN